jgi:hypothetical protein
MVAPSNRETGGRWLGSWGVIRRSYEILVTKPDGGRRVVAKEG